MIPNINPNNLVGGNVQGNTPSNNNYNKHVEYVNNQPIFNNVTNIYNTYNPYNHINNNIIINNNYVNQPKPNNPSGFSKLERKRTSKLPLAKHHINTNNTNKSDENNSETVANNLGNQKEDELNSSNPVILSKYESNDTDGHNSYTSLEQKNFIGSDILKALNNSECDISVSSVHTTGIIIICKSRKTRS